MKKGMFLAMCFVFLTFGLSFSQPETTVELAAPEAETPAPEAEKPVLEEAQTQWVWGEVVTVDAATKTMVVKYLDYETDQEKEIALEAAQDATYENISSFEEIKPKDAVSVDYIVSPEGKNIAKNISVEKQELQSAPEEVMPEEMQPAESAESGE